MWWKLLLFLFLVAVIFGEREVNSEIRITRLSSTDLDSVTVYKAWVQYFTDVRYPVIRKGKWVMLKMHFPEVVATQVMHETAWLTSEIYRQNQNLFGMKHNLRGYSIGTNLGHALYMNRANSVKDYMIYQDRMIRLALEQGRPAKTDEDYYALLEDLPHLRGHRYATDLQYIPKLRAVRKRFEDL